MIEIHEVWHYQRRFTYDAEGGETHFFAEYVNTFFGGKIEASDWPASVTTDKEKEAFIAEVKSKEGIDLKPERIEKNPGLRAICKLCLNSV